MFKLMICPLLTIEHSHIVVYFNDKKHSHGCFLFGRRDFFKFHQTIEEENKTSGFTLTCDNISYQKRLINLYGFWLNPKNGITLTPKVRLQTEIEFFDYTPENCEKMREQYGMEIEYMPTIVEKFNQIIKS